MRIVVSHLTRMQPGYICVAGIDLDTRRHVRPVTEGRRLGAHLLRYNQGPFDIGAMIDLGDVRYVGRAPEVEDYDFNPRRVTVAGDILPAAFLDLLHRTSQTRLRDIFGDALQLSGQTCAVAVGAGTASLGSLIPKACSLFLDQRGTIRLRVADEIGDVRLPVTDLRLFEDDFTTPRRRTIQEVAGHIRDGDAVVLGVGLTRPFGPNGGPARHWLQVNSIILGSDPIRQHASQPASRARAFPA